MIYSAILTGSFTPYVLKARKPRPRKDHTTRIPRESRADPRLKTARTCAPSNQRGSFCCFSLKTGNSGSFCCFVEICSHELTDPLLLRNKFLSCGESASLTMVFLLQKRLVGKRSELRCMLMRVTEEAGSRALTLI